MYPIHLEQQYESLFTSEFDRFSKVLMTKIRPVMEHFPAGKEPVNKDRARADADDPFSLIEAIRAAMTGAIESTDAGKIEMVFRLLDEWNRSYMDESLSKVLERLNTPQEIDVTGRELPTKWITTTRISGSMIDTVLDRTVKLNSALKQSLFSEHANSIFDILSNGLSNGKSFPEMVDELQRQTGADRNKARFWARDQASKFYGKVNQTRQSEAGIPGYVWRCVTDGITRDNHYAMNGTYHDWKNPPAVGVNGEKRHPGEDFNCRCWAEPAFGKGYEDPTALQTKFEDRNLSNGFVTGRNMIAEVINITKLPQGMRVQENADMKDWGSHTPSTGLIELKPGIPTPISTSVHEMAHYLDTRLFGNGKTISGSATAAYSEIQSQLQASHMTGMLERIGKTAKVIQYVDKTDSGEITNWYAYRLNGKTFAMKDSDRLYFLKDREVFARVSEKYFAIKSGNSAMSAEIAHSDKIMVETYGFSMYPSDSEMEKLVPLLDSYFARVK